MKLKNYEIDAFTKLLYDMKLKGKESRMRTRLVKQLDEYSRGVIAVERSELIAQYAEKDEQGQIVLNEDKTQAILSEDTIPEFNAEYSILMNEQYVIEENETNKEMLLNVAQSVLNCDIELSGNEAIMYDNWCEGLEELIVRYNTNEAI
jgi:hypothetical protein